MENLTPLCACGCGQPVPLAKHDSARYGHVAGQPTKYRVGHRAQRGVGYRRRDGDAIHRHRAVKALGRPLPAGAIVHHADCSRSEFAPLVICQDEPYHKLLHARTRLVKAGVNPDTHSLCKRCLQAKPRSEFTPIQANALGINARCKPCCAAMARERRARVH